MQPDADDPWLLALGAAVSDGKAIDWDAALRSAPDTGRRQLVEQMRRVADLAAAHGEQPSGRWRHLLLFEKIGEGAFGAVYRGWDPQLERDVAVKLLSSSGGDGTSPIDEARHLARVRHQNIVTVHGADRDAGQAGLWMEYLKGQTLDAMVRASGPMSAREATAVALDLSHALSALHGAGLLHRDIKASNVMREVGGRIVLMDFSGAHAKTPAGDVDRFSGTPLFMAPELFVGRTATPASDVYSLGVLLFYLLTGALPVTGGSLEELKGAHTSGARKRLRDLRPDLPDAIVQVIERMTAADPARRLQTAGDVEAALIAASGLQDRAAPPPRRLVLWPIAVAAMVLLAALLSFFPRPSADVGPQVRFTVGPPYMSNGWPRLSLQGTLAFGTFVEGRDRFWVRPLDASEGHVLTGTTATETPFWSPDGRTLGFFADGKLKKIPIDGGDLPQTITDAQSFHGGNWSGNWILFATDAGIFRVAPDGSARAQVTRVDPAQADRQHAWPELLPDGKHFLYVVRSNKPERAGLYFAAIDGGEQRRLTEAYSRTAYSAGHILFVREGTLQAQPFDAASGVISGQPVALAPHVKFHPHTDAAFDATPGGILAYAADAGLATTRLVLFDRRGRELRVVAPPAQTYRQPRFSPDGSRVVAEKGDPNETQTDLWVFDVVRGRQSRFATGTDHNVNPAWSPTGDRIAFSKRIDGQFTIVSKAVDGTAPEERLASLGGDTLLEDWSSDGKYLTATLRRSGLWVIPLDPKRKPWLVRGDARPDMWQSEISPDSRWIAYSEEVAGRPEVFVEPLLSRGRRWQISTQGGGEPHWRGDGGELFYLTPEGALMSMDVTAGDWQRGTPVQHFRMLVADIGGKLDYTLSPDAQQIVVNVFVADPAALPISVVVNWPKLLRGR